ncbi:MAG TPA: FprA family A-type flavoprotein [Chlamydiales bacterium]|nr:FprA family A-type flavoprotein [Chlamydiales bacterium]
MEIAPDIFYVGYEDWPQREFHGFTTNRGVTYNSYLILDDQPVLMDTVKEPFFDQMIENIEQHISIEKLQYVVVNHAEPDHAGSIAKLMKKAPHITILCNAKCKEILSAYHDTQGWKFQIIGLNETISIGKKTLQFIMTPMVHWPESMMTYLKEDQILFSMDAFGQHYCSSSHFDDEVDQCELFEELKKYFANILPLYARSILNALEALKDIPLKMVAPSHGVIWRKGINKAVQLYQKWCNFEAEKKVLILYDSMWGSSEKLAQAFFEGISEEGVLVKMLPVRHTPLTDIAYEALDSACICFGSATLNKGMMPQLSAVLTYLKGLSMQKKKTFVFGTYGWGIGAIEAIEKEVQTMGYESIMPSFKQKWSPKDTDLQECQKIGKQLALQIKK